MLAGVSLVVACGRVGFDASSPDAIGTNDAAGNGGGDAGVLGPFAPAVPLAELDVPAGKDDPSLSGDLLEIYFNASNELWRATRATSDAPFGPPQLATELNTASAESTPELVADGLTIYLASDRGGDTDIWQAARTSRGVAFGPPVRVVELATAGVDLSATPTPDQLLLVIDRGGDLYSSSRADAQAPWANTTPIAGVNSTAIDTGGALDDSGTLLVWATDRAGGAGGFDLWWASRTDRTTPWSAPAPIAELNTFEGEADPWLSPDARTIVFARTDGRLYMARR